MLKRCLELAACLCLFLSIYSCSSRQLIKPDQDRIDAYVQAHPDLSELDKTCLNEGRFEPGMHQETLRFMMGEPKKIVEIPQQWAMQHEWRYARGRVFVIEKERVVGIRRQ